VKLIYHLADGQTLVERQEIPDLDAQEALKKVAQEMVTVTGLAPLLALRDHRTGRWHLVPTANLIHLEVDPEDQEEDPDPDLGPPGPNVGHFD
jgi:hypothetical protein